MNLYELYTTNCIRIIQQTHNIALFMSFFALFNITLSSTHFFMRPNKRVVHNLCIKSTLSNFPSIYEIVLPFYRCRACVVLGRYVSYWFYRNCTAAVAK